TMVNLPADQKADVTEYLAKSFPEQPRPAPVVIPGPVKVSIKEWNVPTLGSRPHDPEPGPDGSIWWTGMFANVLGRFNPKTGENKVGKTPTERANPYGMVMSSKAIPFVCDFGTNKIIRIDPETLAIKEYDLPNPDTRPRRIAISPDDIIWYSDYSRGYLGRLDPKTGKVTDWPSPSGPRSQPYGITYLNGAIWYVESAIRPNVLVRFDIKTEKFQSWTIPGV